MTKSNCLKKVSQHWENLPPESIHSSRDSCWGLWEMVEFLAEEIDKIKNLEKEKK